MTIKRKYGTVRLENIGPYRWYLMSILVDRDHRNCGIGTALMKRVLRNCKGTIYLLASDGYGSEFQRLVQFYERFGFKQCKDLDDLEYNYNMIRE